MLFVLFFKENAKCVLCVPLTVHLFSTKMQIMLLMQHFLFQHLTGLALLITLNIFGPKQKLLISFCASNHLISIINMCLFDGSIEASQSTLLNLKDTNMNHVTFFKNLLIMHFCYSYFGLKIIWLKVRSQTSNRLCMCGTSSLSVKCCFHMNMYIPPNLHLWMFIVVYFYKLLEWVLLIIIIFYFTFYI